MADRRRSTESSWAARLLLLAWASAGCTESPEINSTSELFSGAAAFDAGGEARSLAVADLNGDGLPDVAVANYGYYRSYDQYSEPGNVAVLLQDPRARGSFLAPVPHAAGDHPTFVAIDDLNGDGLPDLAVANDISDNVSVVLQDPGSPGSFLPATDYAAGLSPQCVAIGDLNDDGLPDLAVANSGVPYDPGVGPCGASKTPPIPGDVSVLFQDASSPGSFLDAVGLAAGEHPRCVAIGDLNDDGLPDLVAADPGDSYAAIPGRLLVLPQDPGAPGSFLDAVLVDTAQPPTFVAVEDLNGDGLPDMVAGGYRISVLLQDGALPGSFAEEVVDTIGVAIAVGHLNDDGLLDLAAGNDSGGVSVLLQDAGAPGSFVFRESLFFWYVVKSVAIADMNVDGRPELVAASGGSVTVLWR